MKSVFVEKKENYRTHAVNLLHQLKEQLNLTELSGLRILNRYDIEDHLDSSGDSPGPEIYSPGTEVYKKICGTILSEPPVDNLYEDDFPMSEDETAFGVQYLPGQYDQRADSASQCIQLVTHGSREKVITTRIYVLKGSLGENEINKVKNYLINKVDSKESSPASAKHFLKEQDTKPAKTKSIEGLISLDRKELGIFHRKMKLSMSLDDLTFCQEYFRSEEERDPTDTELKVLDTYWSDHCRHTTFTTAIDEVVFEEGKYSKVIEDSWNDYLESREYVYGKLGNSSKNISLMDMAVIG